MQGKRTMGLLAIAALGACAPVHATRPMVVDDAGITAPDHCQAETWFQHPSGQNEYWAVPACNVGGSWELALGGGRIAPRGAGSPYAAGVFQAKTIFHALEKNGWGIGLTIAHQFYQGSGLGHGDSSVLVPLSLSMLDDQVLVHANLGMLRKRSGRRHDAFWALGVEWNAQPHLALTLEAYGAAHDAGFVQAGLRYTLVPDRLDLDAGIGQRFRLGGAERYFTLGLTAAWPLRR